MMKRLSISDAWTRAMAFTRAEAALIFPLALLLIGLPPVIVQLSVNPEEVRAMLQGGPPPPALWLQLPVLLVALIGWLAVSAMALVPRIAVGEALALALKRLWTPVGAALLLFAGLFAVTFALALALGAAFATLGGSQTLLVTIVAMAMVFAGLVASVLLLLVAAVAVGERAGPVAALRRAHGLARGQLMRMTAALILLTLAMLVVTLAVSSVLGLIALPIGAAMGSPDLARVVIGLASAVVTTVFSVLMIATAAEVYRTLASSGT